MHSVGKMARAVSLLVSAVLTPGLACASGYQVLYRFSSAKTGTFPSASLTLDMAGNLYGTTRVAAVLFKLSPGGHERVVANLNPLGQAFGGVLRDARGNSFGMTQNAVYEVSRAGRVRTLESFGEPGSTPANMNLIEDATGIVYGTHPAYGVYKIDAGGHYTSLLNINNSVAGLAMDAAGNLYGTTFEYASVVFKIAPGGSSSMLHTFGINAGGSLIGSAVILDSSGNLYGTTSLFGCKEPNKRACSDGDGVVFKLDPWGDETVLHTFTGADGSGPQAALVMDGAGRLYGTTMSGGSAGLGVVFAINSDGTGFSVLHQFAGGQDGAYPESALVFDGNGNLYGTTSEGGGGGSGTAGVGTIYSLPSGGL